MNSVGWLWVFVAIMIVVVITAGTGTNDRKTLYEEIDAYLSKNPDTAKKWFEVCQYRLEPKKCVAQIYVEGNTKETGLNK